MKIFARVFLLLPLFGMWREGLISVSWLLGLGIAALAWLTMLDSNRSPYRTPICVILARMFGGMWLLNFVLLKFWNHATGTKFWSFWEISLSSMTTTMLMVGVYWFFSWLGAQLVKDDPEYRQWKRAGGHYYFDTIPRMFNPDSELVRNGGILEPDSGFVPPADWRFRCPVCGARVQFEIDVCWNCNYGADGDSSAYYERWGQGKERE